MEEKKICTKCKEEKELLKFNKNRAHCRSCDKEYRDSRKEEKNSYNKLYNLNNKEKLKDKRKKYYLNNKEIIKKRIFNYVKKNVEKRKKYLEKYRKEYREKNKNEIRESKNKYKNEKLKSDPLFKLTYHIRRSITRHFKKNKFRKNSKTQEILGCSFKEFKIYIESKFESWMTWDNYGKYNGQLNFGWDLDHIIPISSAKTEEDIIKLNHYTNFQPLDSKINRDIKRNKF